MAKKKKKQTEPTPEQEKEQYKLEYIRTCKRNAEDAARERRDAWKELWQAFQNKQRYNKKSWQAKIYVPKIWMKVEKAAGEVKRALINLDKLWKFTLDPEYAETLTDDQKEKAEQEMASVERRFKRRLEKSNLADVYAEMIKPAFLLGLGVPKVLWDYKKKNLTYENVEAENVNISSDYKPNRDDKPEHLIETQEMSLAKLRKIAKEINEDSGQKIYDFDKIDLVEEEAIKQEKKAEEQARKGLGDVRKKGKRVILDQFWGDIISEDGKEIEENLLLVVANGKYIIREQPNPFNHGKPPYPLTQPLVYPHRGMAGISLVEAVLPLQKIYNNIINMVIDNLNWIINKANLYDPNAFTNPKDMFTIYPGKMVACKSPTTAAKPFEVTPLGREVFLFLNLLKQEIEEGTSVTEFLTGMPSQKAKTLGEIQIKTMESKGLFDTVARDLERNSIRPLLEMSYSLLVQFAEFPNIEGKYIFSVGGLSLLLMQKEMVETIGEILSVALKEPDLKQMTDIDDLWQKLLGIHNLSEVYQEPPKEIEAMPPMGQTASTVPQGQPNVAKIQAIRRKAVEDARRKMSQTNPQDLVRMIA